MISGVHGRGLESWGHLSLEGERRSNRNETNLPTPRPPPPLTLSPAHHPFLLASYVHASSSNGFPPFLVLSIYTSFSARLFSCGKPYYNLFNVAPGESIS